MKFLVTGGAGFIGSHLTEALLGNGHRVRVLDDFSTGRRENLSALAAYPAFELVEGDLRDPGVAASVVAGMDGVFHLAAMVSVTHSVDNPRLSHEINAGGTFNVLEAARAIGLWRIVYASSSAVYGDNPRLPLLENEPPNPTSPYGLDKWYGEELARLYHAQFGLETTALRFFNVYGPRQDPSNPYSGVITKFLNCLTHGETPTIFGNGEQTRDFVHVEDVARACMAVMEAPSKGFKVYNVASGKKVSINELFAKLKNIAGCSVAARHADKRPGEILHTLGDISAIRTDLGYQPRVELRMGLTGVHQYFQEAGPPA